MDQALSRAGAIFLALFVFLIWPQTSSQTAAAGETPAPSPAEIPERIQFTEDDLPKDENDPAGVSEIDEFAQRHGFNYAKLTRRAARGDSKALKRFFMIAQEVDGAAAESHEGVPAVVYHLLGDEKFAKFLRAQPLAYQMMVRNSIANDSSYFRRYFPETARIFYRREIVDWPSPNQQYAIRKIFSSEFDVGGSKVEKAELIEQKTGRVLCDLTPDDIGTGGAREGEVLWAPDSKRFAYRSSDLTEHEGNLFNTPPPPPQRKQTAVYQASGDSFTRVALPLSEVPGRESDSEVTGAVLGHEYTEPVRWEKPNVLLLERHEYFETLKPMVVGDKTFNTVHPFSRWYRITATIAPDGKAALIWKPRKED